ncbi:capsid protein [Liquorilactobacillus satsumensis]|uniref:minor capsid protein n=1 Tax=Liquorilactobacillus satsumensis TaxID=259059 RepID=UPI0021C343E9|nr:minor capsid protein [Liquorilactobacillus satsumensis]MCP9357376.1 capsid protein [Liquorilactobacillus satsumensis]MCP9372064.1 capsid protein [Liquorilactobacillus satsumensis]
MRLPVPTESCNQSIVLKQYVKGTGLYRDPSYKDPVTITKCVVQLQTQYTGTNDNRQLIANGTVFFYADVTSPMPALDKTSLGSKIEFEGQEYTVQTLDELKQPFSNDLFGYQLGVL